MHYVYLLQSEVFVDQRYVGMASDLKRRLSEHTHSAACPWPRHKQPPSLSANFNTSQPRGRRSGN